MESLARTTRSTVTAAVTDAVPNFTNMVSGPTFVTSAVVRPRNSGVVEVAPVADVLRDDEYVILVVENGRLPTGIYSPVIAYTVAVVAEATAAITLWTLPTGDRTNTID